MRHTDVAIVGGGLAGSTAAAMLGRAGVGVALIDPYGTYPPDFRCEKLDGSQVRILRKTGLADAVLRAATPDTGACVARFGRLIEKRSGDQHGILYDTLVNTIRAEIPESVALIRDKAKSLTTSADRQSVTLSSGEEICARLVVLANGLNNSLRQSLGMPRAILSPCHSITIGFDLRPIDGSSFEFSSLTYYPERVADQIAYLTLFPIGSAVRANFMIYRRMHDPWLEQFPQAPTQILQSALPGLSKLTGAFEVAGYVKIRPADLYATQNYRRPGVVLVGDAFATSCPAAGTGAGKVFTDVERLCNIHIPRWLGTEGMGEEKITAFYDDPVKKASDAQSIAKAYHLRSLSIDPSLRWAAARWGRVAAGLTKNTLRQVRGARGGLRKPVPNTEAEFGKPA